jgi:uncharacterized Zn finger protein
MATKTYNAYCVKCKEKRDFEGEVVKLKNDKPAAKGNCPVCGTKVMRFLKST